MKTCLIAHTIPLLRHKTEPRFLTAEELIVYCARVSNPSNQDNVETGEKLLRYCIKMGHWSVFETASLTIEVETSRAIAAQILRHRSFTFQEFCVSGDTKITLELPSSKRIGKRVAYSRTIKHLFDLQQRGLKMPSSVRVFDESSRTFITAAIREVFQTGTKPLFRVTLENGKRIESTKEHRFLTGDGFKTLEDAAGLSVVGNLAVWSNSDCALACNGVAAYTDREWLSLAKQRAITSSKGLRGIAEDANISTHTIRKWLKKHRIQFTKKEVGSYRAIWNRGKRYTKAPHSLETIQKMRASAKKGSESNLWRGGVTRHSRLAIADWCATVRAELLLEAGHKCNRCGSSKKLELHHIVPVSEDRSLARQKSNIEVVCFSCHRAHHGILGHTKTWREKSRGNALTIHWSKVKSIEYIGEEMTYDMEVDHTSHNYIGNGIVTHNSQRYAVSAEFEPVELRSQDTKNRQGSGEVVDPHVGGMTAGSSASDRVAFAMAVCESAYHDLIAAGVSKETARMVLPLCTRTTLYVTGSVRSWVHYFEQRCSPHAQKEHRLLAEEIRDTHFKLVFPSIHAIITTKP